MFLDKAFIDHIGYVAYVPRMAGNQADRQGLSHLEPKSQELKSSQVGVPTCFFIRILYINQIRCCLCARDRREPCRTMQDHADRWGLSHLEPPESQATLVQSCQIGVPACLWIRPDQIRYVASAHRMVGNRADRWGLSHVEPPKSQPTLVELRSSQVGVPTCFFIRVL